MSSRIAPTPGNAQVQVQVGKVIRVWHRREKKKRPKIVAPAWQRVSEYPPVLM